MVPVLSIVPPSHHCAFSIDGLVGDEAACFLKHLGRSLSVASLWFDGCRLDWHLLWFEQLMFVLGDQELNGDD